MSNWPTEVGAIKNGVTSFSEDGLGVLINNLTLRTEWLKEAIDAGATGVGTKTGFALYDTGFSPSCSVGMVVAWDKSSGVYVPARALGTGMFRPDGTEIPADESYALGVLIGLDPETTGGTILCYGCTDDPNIVEKLLGDSPIPGDYYLSPDEAGKVYCARYSENQMSAYCLTCLYSANDKYPTVFVRPYPPAYNGSPELRSIVVDKDSPLLEVESDSGVAKIKLNATEIQRSEGTGKALSGVADNGFIYNPVVNNVTAGAGIVVNQTSPGYVVVSTAGALGSVLDLNLCALDGVYLSTSNTNAVIYTFPAGVDSALSGVIRVPYIGGTKVTGRINILLEGSGNLSDLNVLEVTVQETQGDINPLGTPIVYDIQNIATTDTSMTYKIAVDLNQLLSSNALVYVKLDSVNPVNPTKVLSVSLELTGVSDER